MNNLTNKLEKYQKRGYIVPSGEIIKTKEQLEGIRESGKINTEILDYISEQITDGITTGDIDRLIHEKTLSLGGIPAPLGYQGYPKSICVSIDDVVCHGIPSDERVLKDGEIFNVDVSTIYQDYFSDSSRMFTMGDVLPENDRLIAVTKECMKAGIEQVRPWGFINDVGVAIETLAKKNGYSVVREVGGHGIGCEFHEDPFVSHVAQRETGMLLVPGMVFTVEPMVNMGSHKIYQDMNDGWTIRTVDGSPSAQWENMVCVTDNGYELLAW